VCFCHRPLFFLGLFILPVDVFLGESVCCPIQTEFGSCLGPALNPFGARRDSVIPPALMPCSKKSRSSPWCALHRFFPPAIEGFSHLFSRRAARSPSRSLRRQPFLGTIVQPHRHDTSLFELNPSPSPGRLQLLPAPPRRPYVDYRIHEFTSSVLMAARIQPSTIQSAVRLNAVSFGADPCHDSPEGVLDYNLFPIPPRAFPTLVYNLFSSYSNASVRACRGAFALSVSHKFLFVFFSTIFR